MMTAVRIGLIADTRSAYARAEVRGIIAYARLNNLPWSFAGGMDSPATWRMLRRWKPQGIIGITLERVLRSRVPAVKPLLPDPAGVAMLDNEAIGRMAAEHVLSRGFRHLAFVGERGADFSEDRGNGFQSQWRCTCGDRPEASFHRLNLPYEEGMDWHTHLAKLTPWLKSLPKPVGILAVRDQRAREVLQACQAIHLRVPEDVAVVGVDNDDLLCEMSDPPLSSVSVPWEQIGHHMGASIQRLLQGDARPRVPPLIAPGGVVVRRSSDVYATADEAVVQACRHIQEHASAALTVETLARTASVSRRGIERRFRKELGRSPRQEIELIRFRNAQHLLRETDLSMAAVSEQCGFTSCQRLIAVFRRRVGTTPSAYRATYRTRL